MTLKTKRIPPRQAVLVQIEKHWATAEGFPNLSPFEIFQLGYLAGVEWAGVGCRGVFEDAMDELGIEWEKVPEH